MYEDVRKNMHMKNIIRKIETKKDLHITQCLLKHYKKTFFSKRKRDQDEEMTLLPHWVEWRSIEHGLILFDHVHQQVRAWIPLKQDDIFLLPPMCNKKKKRNEEVRLSPLAIEQEEEEQEIRLHNDVLYYIFKFVPTYELLNLRLVSKQWNRIITSNKSFWNLESPCIIPEWKYLSPMRLYIKVMFLNCDTRDLICCLQKHPSLFEFITTPELRKHFSVKLSPVPTILRDGERIEMKVFLDLYRRKRIKKCLL